MFLNPNYMYIHLFCMKSSTAPTLPCLCANIRRASRAITQRYDEALRPLGLTITQFTILQALSLAGDITQGRLGEILAMDSTTLTRTLGVMNRQGWIAEGLWDRSTGAAAAPDPYREIRTQSGCSVLAKHRRRALRSATRQATLERPDEADERHNLTDRGTGSLSMAQLSEHPTVKQVRAREATDAAQPRPESLDREWLRQLCLEAGADDAGFVEIDRPEIADQRSEILSLLPRHEDAREPCHADEPREHPHSSTVDRQS